MRIKYFEFNDKSLQMKNDCGRSQLILLRISYNSYYNIVINYKVISITD